MTAIVHELMDHVALDQKSRALFGPDEIDGEDCQEAAEDRPWKNLRHGDPGYRERWDQTGRHNRAGVR